MKPFHDTVFGWEGWVFGEPGWKEDGDGSKDNEKSREEWLLPGLLGGLIHGEWEFVDG